MASENWVFDNCRLALLGYARLVGSTFKRSAFRNLVNDLAIVVEIVVGLARIPNSALQSRLSLLRKKCVTHYATFAGAKGDFICQG